MLDELGNVIDGFDWEIDANMAFNLFYPHRGTDRGLVLTYGRDVVAVTTTINPDTYANAVYFTGSMPITLPVEVAVSTFPPEIGRWDMQKSNPSLVRADTVAEQAAEALADASTLVPTLSITLRADVWNPYTLWLGDTVRAIVQTGRLDIDVHERVMEIDVSLDDDGVETVALALGTAPARLSDRFGDMEAAIAMLELQPTGLGGTPVGDYPGYPGDPFGGPGGDFPFGDFGGGGGGGGGIVEITSSDASITVTNPTGPVTDLSVAAGHITVLNPTGPIVDLVYSAPGGGINSYPNVEIVSYRDVDTYYTFSFRGGADGCEVVLDPVATGQPPTAGVGWVAQIVEPGFYTMSITITSLASLSLDPITGAPRYFGGAVVPYLPPFSGGGSWFLDPLSPPVTFTTGAFVTAGQIAAAPAPGLFLEWQLITAESVVGVDLHGLIDVTVSSTRS
jgi:hypothetical protein